MTAVVPHYSARHLERAVEVVGLVGIGPLAQAVLHRVLGAEEDTRGRLRVVASPQIAVVLGEPTDLPWVDGAVYLRHEGSLLVPTWQRVDVPWDVLQRALARRHPELAWPALLLPDQGWLVSVAAASAPDPVALRSRMEEWRG